MMRILCLIYMVSSLSLSAAHYIEMPISDNVDIFVLLNDHDDENDLTKQLELLISGDIFMQKYAFIILLSACFFYPVIAADKNPAADAFFHMQHIAARPSAGGTPLSNEYQSFLMDMRPGDDFSSFSSPSSWTVGSLLGAAAVGAGYLVVNEVKAMIVYAARRRVQNAIVDTASTIQTKLTSQPPTQDTQPLLPSSAKDEEVDPMDMNNFIQDGKAQETQSAIESLTLTQLHMLAASEEATNPTCTFFRQKYQERLESNK